MNNDPTAMRSWSWGGKQGVRGFSSPNIFSFSDNFSGVAPLSWSGSTWTTGSGVSINTPTLGNELVTNGGFGTDTNWYKGTGWAIAVGVAAHTAVGAGNLTEQILSSGSWYQTSYTLSGLGGGSTTALFGSVAGPARASDAGFTETNLANAASAGVSGPADLVISIDNISYKAITLSTLFRTLPANAANIVTESIDVTVGAGDFAGLVINLDSISAPGNFVLFRMNQTNAFIDKCVGGTYTNVLTSAITYAAGQTLQAKKNGTTYQLFYNGAQISTDKTISDAGIISNTIHGLFSTVAGNTLDNFSVVAQ